MAKWLPHCKNIILHDLLFLDNSFISLPATPLETSEADRNANICAEVTFGQLDADYTITFRTISTGSG